MRRKEQGTITTVTIMKNITRREAIEAIKGIFETNKGREDNMSRLIENEDGTATFLLDKRKYERCEIIRQLTELFEGVVIIDGICRIEGLTLLFTTVKIEKRNLVYGKNNL